MCGLIVFSKSERPSYFFYFGINRPVGKHSNGSFDSVETKALKVGGRTHVQDLSFVSQTNFLCLSFAIHKLTLNSVLYCSNFKWLELCFLFVFDIT